MAWIQEANSESSEVCGIIKPGIRFKLNRSQAVNVHKLLTIRYLTSGLYLSLRAKKEDEPIHHAAALHFGFVVDNLRSYFFYFSSCGSF